MLGIIVHGNNHFIVTGPLPGPHCARALVRHWELPRLETAGGRAPEADFSRWTITTKAFRENLMWAIELEGDTDVQAAVRRLLQELVDRGIEIHRARGPLFPPGGGEDWQGEGCG